MELITLLVIGLVGGFAATKMLKTTSYGLTVDTIVGAFGAYAGGFLFALLKLAPTDIVMTSVIGLVSAVALHAIINALPSR